MGIGSTPLQDGVNAILVAEAVLKAARTGSTVPVPVPAHVSLA